MFKRGASAFVLGFLLLMPVRAMAEFESFTIHLRTGEILQEVSAEPDQKFKVMRLEAGRVVSFTEITAIYRGDEDVTRAILGRDPTPATPGASPASPSPAPAEDPAPPDPAPEDGAEETPEAATTPPRNAAPSPWLSESSEVYQSARRTLWKWGLLVGGNLSAPAGSYFDGFEAGPGFDVELLVAVTHNGALRACVSRSGAKVKAEVLTWFEPVVPIEDLDATIMRYSLAAQAYSHLDRPSGDPSMIYAYAGIGAVNTKITVKVISAGEGSASETKLMTSLGGGVTKTLARNLAVDARLHMDQIWLDSQEYQNSYAWLFDAKLGMLILF